MTFEQEEMIRQLKYKVRLLMAKFQTLKKENEALVTEKNELLTVIEKQKREISNLEQQYTTAKLAKSVLIPSEDRDTAKAQIKRIVREIDECIALLNR
jgi:chromosome segregation ATPase